jgi:hypothetical protein
VATTLTSCRDQVATARVLPVRETAAELFHALHALQHHHRERSQSPQGLVWCHFDGVYGDCYSGADGGGWDLGSEVPREGDATGLETRF